MNGDQKKIGHLTIQQYYSAEKFSVQEKKKNTLKCLL